jgi:EAL domain-containing protein (putative c-di-GMP-specific phosphodiesterase class I)
MTRFPSWRLSPNTLIIQADLALYRAKRDGRNCCRFHSAEPDTEVRERTTTADGLRNAVSGGELQLYYQPQVELASGWIVGVEGLLRWIHPTRGVLEPIAFPSVRGAHRHPCRAGRVGAEEARRQMWRWSDLGIAPDRVAIDASAGPLKPGPRLERSLSDKFNQGRIPPFAIELELTESVLIEVTKEQSGDLDRLRRLGISIAIDGFGTGYAWLSDLAGCPVDRLKIVKELMVDVGRNHRKAGVVRAAIRLAQELGVALIAEGVEDAAQVGFLTAAGCLHGQGVYFGDPVSAEEMTARLRVRKCNAAAAVGARREARSAPTGDDPMPRLAISAC